MVRLELQRKANSALQFRDEKRKIIAQRQSADFLSQHSVVTRVQRAKLGCCVRVHNVALFAARAASNRQNDGPELARTRISKKLMTKRGTVTLRSD